MHGCRRCVGVKSPCLDTLRLGGFHEMLLDIIVWWRFLYNVLGCLWAANFLGMPLSSWMRIVELRKRAGQSQGAERFGDWA